MTPQEISKRFLGDPAELIRNRSCFSLVHSTVALIYIVTFSLDSILRLTGVFFAIKSTESSNRNRFQGGEDACSSIDFLFDNWNRTS